MKRISLLALVVALAGGTTAAVALAGQAPKALRDSILAAARAQRSVHWAAAEVYGGLAITTGADVTATGGVQHVTFVAGKQKGHAQIVVTSGTAYVEGTAFGLELSIGLTKAQAAKYAGKWIAIPKGDKLYAPTAGGDTVGSLVQAMSPHGKLSVVSLKVRRKREVGVRGIFGTGKTKTATVLITGAKGKPLPLEEDVVTPGKNFIDHTTFSKWNEGVTVTAPENSIPISTVRG